MSDDVYLQSQKITKDYKITSEQLRKLANDGKIRFNEPKNGSNRKTYHIGDIEKYLELNVSQPESSDKKPSARTLRRKDNEDSNEFVIKCGLDNSIKIDSNFKGDLLKELRNRMIETSRASHRVGLLVNIFIRECIQNTSNPLDIKIPTELLENETFVYQLITGKFQKEIPEVVKLLDKYKVSNHTIKRYNGDRNSLITVAAQYITNFKTFLQVNFEGNQVKFLRLWCIKNDIDTKFIWQIRCKINGWTPKTDLSLDSIDEDQKTIVDNLITYHRKLLDLVDTNKVGKLWIKSNYNRVIIYYSVLSQYLVENNKKGILIAPLPKIKSSFLYIDSNVFYGILRNIKYVNEPKKYNQDMYYEVFNINKLLTASQKRNEFKFTGTIQTDCVSINFHFRRPNIVTSTSKLKLDRNDPNIRVIAQDPGRTTLFYGVEEIEPGEFKKFKLTRNEFHTISGAKKAVKNVNRWNTEEKIAAVLNQLSQTNSRHINLDEFLKYVQIVKDNEEILWNEYTKQRYARQRFALYSGKKKAYDKFFHSIASYGDPKKKVVIAYGDAGFASTAKYEIAAPTTTLEKQCSKWFNVVKVDEFRTTQLHYETGDMLAKVVEVTTVNTKQVNRRTIRGLLWYKDLTTKCCKFIDRDFNAAKNILKCFRIFPKRPTGMSRRDKKQKDIPTHYIKKKIRVEVVTQSTLGSRVVN